jgi:hypothetical protein
MLKTKRGDIIGNVPGAAEQPAPDEDDDDCDLITKAEALVILGGPSKPIDASTFYRAIAAGRYHKPIHPVPGISRWRKRQLIRERDGQGA